MTRHHLLACAAATLLLACSDDASPWALVFDQGPALASDAGADAAAVSDSSRDASAPRDQAGDASPGLRDAGTDAAVGREDMAAAEMSFADQGASQAPCPMPPPVGYRYMVGQPVFGQNDYIEYIPGDLPIILTAAHGGTLEPQGFEIELGTNASDGGSQQLARLVHARLGQLTGRTPHLVINHIKRNRLNLNRDDASPNAQHPPAIAAYDEFHGFIEDAKAWVTAACGQGHYFDLHTHGRRENAWVEIGLGLSKRDLLLGDEQLAGEADDSFYRHLAGQPGADFAQLVRGPTSLGGLLEAQSFEGSPVRAVPSPKNPDLGPYPYFNGGFNTQAHGSRQGGHIDATQLEFHFSQINAGARKRQAFSIVLSDVLRTFVETHYGFDLSAP